jgi:hypothetical protein
LVEKLRLPINYTLKHSKNSTFSKYIWLLPPDPTKFELKVVSGISDLKNTGQEALRIKNQKFDLIPKFFPNRPLCVTVITFFRIRSKSGKVDLWKPAEKPHVSYY